MWSRRTSEDSRSPCKVIELSARRPFRIGSADDEVKKKENRLFKLINNFFNQFNDRIISPQLTLKCTLFDLSSRADDNKRKIDRKLIKVSSQLRTICRLVIQCFHHKYFWNSGPIAASM